MCSICVCVIYRFICVCHMYSINWIWAFRWRSTSSLPSIPRRKRSRPRPFLALFLPWDLFFHVCVLFEPRAQKKKSPRQPTRLPFCSSRSGPGALSLLISLLQVLPLLSPFHLDFLVFPWPSLTPLSGVPFLFASSILTFSRARAISLSLDIFPSWLRS